MEYPQIRFIRSSLMFAGAFSILLLGGCASVGGGVSSKVAKTTQANYYPACYEPVSHLRASDAAMQKSVTTGAVTGGLLGGLAGALSGGDNAGRNALIGAAAGALVGGAAGYYTERQRQISDDRQRIASYGSDFERSTMDLDRSIVHAKAAQDCYQREFESLRAAHRNKTMSDSEGRNRFAEILSGLKETNALLAAADGRTGEDINTYTQAYEKDLQQVGLERQQVAVAAKVESAPASKPAPAAKPVPQEAVVTEQKIQKASAKRSEAQQVSSRGTGIISSACNNPDLGDWAPDPCTSV
ncbi:17 kDa surface antigen [Ectopseudomonas mendocina DLHK]|nr:type VI secretion-associated lipoprotein TagQ [Pseudomonas mendocina]EJO91456.1 17 kDa surface antigen [Pseudomonas mendocina DLHK]